MKNESPRTKRRRKEPRVHLLNRIHQSSPRNRLKSLRHLVAVGKRRAVLPVVTFPAIRAMKKQIVKKGKGARAHRLNRIHQWPLWLLRQRRTSHLLQDAIVATLLPVLHPVADLKTKGRVVRNALQTNLEMKLWWINAPDTKTMISAVVVTIGTARTATDRDMTTDVIEAEITNTEAVEVHHVEARVEEIATMNQDEVQVEAIAKKSQDGAQAGAIVKKSPDEAQAEAIA